MDILEVIQQDGFTYKKAATTRGGEYAGPCPFCGGRDRFRVWPGSGLYWCRQCEKAGDPVQYLRDYRGLSYFDALLALGREPDFKRKPSSPILTKPREPTVSPEKWQERARELLAAAVDCLWSNQGATVRQWLKSKKGLQDETIRAAHLGYIRQTIFDSRPSWGLPEAVNEKGNPKMQWLPQGIVIPSLQDENIQRLKIRREHLPPEDVNRYIFISGGAAAPMVLGDHSKAVAVIVESELDGLLLQQEAGDLIMAVAMGSAQAKPDRESHELLKSMPMILLALDTDPAGGKASWSFWPETYGKAFKRWPIPSKFGKDPSEAWQKGLNLFNWICAGIFQSMEVFEKFAIMTVDGKLSDREVINYLTRRNDG